MSILLLGFIADQNGEGDAEFLVSGMDAVRVLRAIHEERAFHKSLQVRVTIFNEALTDDSRHENSEEGGDGSQYDVFAGKP